MLDTGTRIRGQLDAVGRTGVWVMNLGLTQVLQSSVSSSIKRENHFSYARLS